MAAAATAETSRSGSSSAGDSYIGSLISLTSKCEIRYEGILYDINTQESSIGLRNVRAFGTEGRNKDGPQIPASEKVYEYILFRGSDIKDLQVKSSPPAQNASIHNDPAIIQSHYSRPPPPSTIFPSAASGTTPDLSSHTAHLGLPRLPFPGNMPLFQPAGSLGSWGSSPAPPTANGSGLAVPGPMPMYWPGYYAPTGTLPPHLQQPPLMRPPPGLSIPQSMQQPLQYSGVSTLPSGSQNLQEFPSPLLPTFSSTLGSNSATTVPSTSAPTQASSLAPEVSSSHMPTKPTVTSFQAAAALGANLSFMPQFASSLELVPSLSHIMPASISSNPNLVPVSNVSHQTVPQPVSSIFGSASSSQTETSSANAPFLPQLPSNSEYVASISQNMPTSFSSNPRAVPVSNVNYQTMPQSVPSNVGPPNSSLVERSVPLVTPDQLLQPVSSAVSSQPLQTSTKDVEVNLQESKMKPLLPEPSMPSPAETKGPILPLPTPTRQKPNGAVLHSHDISRGRGRGRGHGYPRPMTKFTEDFDFTAMNEKFNKDEVWGHLGKNKAQLRDTDGDIEEEYEILDEDSDEPSKSDSKPIYVKDDFFDTLSCDALDRGSRNGRPRFSEQMKIDVETFGDFSRHRGSRGGGRGFRGGRGRGSYYGRGYGYDGRGRGQSGPYRPF